MTQPPPYPPGTGWAPPPPSAPWTPGPPPPGWRPPPPGWAPAAPLSPTGAVLAEPVDRFVARLIDALILMVPGLAYSLVLIGSMVPLFLVIGEPGVTADRVWPRVGLAVAGYLIYGVLSGLTSYLYMSRYLLAHGGQTIGKRNRGIRVETVDGTPLSSDAARRRWLAYEGVGLLGLIPIVGSITGIYTWANILWQLWDKPNRQCLHDKYAKTVVVKVPRPIGP